MRKSVAYTKAGCLLLVLHNKTTKQVHCILIFIFIQQSLFLSSCFSCIFLIWLQGLVFFMYFHVFFLVSASEKWSKGKGIQLINNSTRWFQFVTCSSSSSRLLLFRIFFVFLFVFGKINWNIFEKSFFIKFIYLKSNQHTQTHSHTLAYTKGSSIVFGYRGTTLAKQKRKPQHPQGFHKKKKKKK